jgi:hypothetical protein
MQKQMRMLLLQLSMELSCTPILRSGCRAELWLLAAAAEQLNGQVAELVVGSLQLMVAHMVGTHVVPLAHNQQVMLWVLVEQESLVPAAVAAATGVATVVRNMVVAAAVLAGPLATWFLCVIRRVPAMETVN